jgi:probable phosphoglycerate mutase
VLYLVRHGETEFNLARRAQGLKDSPLTALGVRQAHAMAGLLAGLVAEQPSAPWRLVASPLGRAVATAEIIAARLGLAVELDARLREHSMGEFDGLHADAFVPRLRHDLPHHERAFHAPGAESYEALTCRIAAFLAEVEADQRLIVVSHGGAGRIVRGLYGGLARDAMLSLDIPQDAVFRLQNGQIDRFDCAPVE